MQKQLSKKSHKATDSSIDDFMKHIRKYNLQSERYISPKPLLYMYTNPSRNFTLQTLQKSRSKSKTLSNRQNSNSKKSSSKTIRKRVQKMLSISKKQNIHKKSISSISNKKQKSLKKINKSTAQIDLTKSKNKLKSKLTEFKLKPMTSSTKKTKKSKFKLQQHPNIQQRLSTMYFDEGSALKEDFHIGQISSETDAKKENPAELIEMYSKKLFKVQLYLDANKNKLGSMLCRKFQQILNQIVESLVENLKKSLNQLQIDIEKRLAKQFQTQFDKSMMKKQQQLRQVERLCQKITRKYNDVLHKQHYANSLIYNLRLQGIDIDNEFGKAVWGVNSLGGLGYNKTQSLTESEDNKQDPISTSSKKQHKMKKLQGQREQSSQGEFEFCEHPSQRKKREQQHSYRQQQPNPVKIKIRQQQFKVQIQEQKLTARQQEYESRKRLKTST